MIYYKDPSGDLSRQVQSKRSGEGDSGSEAINPKRPVGSRNCPDPAEHLHLPREVLWKSTSTGTLDDHLLKFRTKRTGLSERLPWAYRTKTQVAVRRDPPGVLDTLPVFGVGPIVGLPGPAPN